MYRQFNIQQFYVLPTQCIYVFCMDFRTNSDYFPQMMVGDSIKTQLSYSWFSLNNTNTHCLQVSLVSCICFSLLLLILN